MSLIYQALKQSERQTAASPPLVARRAVAAPRAGKKPSPKLRSPLGLGLLIAAVGVAVGYLLNQGFAGPSSALASQPVAAPLGAVTATDLPRSPNLESTSTEVKGLLPRADLPLPTAMPRLQIDRALAPVLKKTPALSAPAVSAQPIAAPTVATPPVKPVASAMEATQLVLAAPAVAIAARTVEVSAAQPSTEDVRTLFEALNQALANQDAALAKAKLQGIQSVLPDSSVARLRAESWFAHQTGDLDNASRIYRRLLEKMPGDELTSVNLASIEKKRQRPDQAKEVLAKALRQNPSSNVLRSAVEQLAQSEVKP